MRFINDVPSQGPQGDPGPQGPQGVGWSDTTGCFLSRGTQTNNSGLVYTKLTMVVRRLTAEGSPSPIFDAGGNNIKVPSTPSSQRYLFTLLFNVQTGLAYSALQVQLRDQANNVIVQLDVHPAIPFSAGAASIPVTFQATLTNPNVYSIWTAVNSTSGNHTINSMTGTMLQIHLF